MSCIYNTCRVLSRAAPGATSPAWPVPTAAWRRPGTAVMGCRLPGQGGDAEPVHPSFQRFAAAAAAPVSAGLGSSAGPDPTPVAARRSAARRQAGLRAPAFWRRDDELPGTVLTQRRRIPARCRSRRTGPGDLRRPRPVPQPPGRPKLAVCPTTYCPCLMAPGATPTPANRSRPASSPASRNRPRSVTAEPARSSGGAGLR